MEEFLTGVFNKASLEHLAFFFMGVCGTLYYLDHRFELFKKLDTINDNLEECKETLDKNKAVLNKLEQLILAQSYVIDHSRKLKRKNNYLRIHNSDNNNNDDPPTEDF
jgi:chromosome segregation ATPase